MSVPDREARPAAGPTLVERVLARDRRSIARAISTIESGGATGDELYRQICALARTCQVVAFTGPPGVGKSSLVGAYIGHLRKQGQTVAVAAVDPSSPVSGGAILGDRVRMADHDGDEEVFIRSIAARGHQGGLSATLYRVADVLAAAGFDRVILETVGTGQADTEVADVADVKILVGAPGLGDDVQAIKSGVIEIADILVLNKADLPLAAQALGQLEAMLKLRQGPAAGVAIVSTVATRPSGIEALAAAIEARIAATGATLDRADRARARMHKLLAQAAARVVLDRLLRNETAELTHICDDVAAGRMSFESGTTAVLGTLSRK
jgi:LAO/AO transport system kinase